MPAVLSTDYDETAAFDGLVEIFDSESSYIYFPDVEGARLVVETIGDDDSLDLAFRVALCYNICEGMPNTLIAAGKLVDASQYNHLTKRALDADRLHSVLRDFRNYAVTSNFTFRHWMLDEIDSLLNQTAGDGDGIEN